jgi:hypothetical protein
MPNPAGTMFPIRRQLQVVVKSVPRLSAAVPALRRKALASAQRLLLYFVTRNLSVSSCSIPKECVVSIYRSRLNSGLEECRGVGRQSINRYDSLPPFGCRTLGRSGERGDTAVRLPFRQGESSLNRSEPRLSKLNRGGDKRGRWTTRTRGFAKPSSWCRSATQVFAL